MITIEKLSKSFGSKLVLQDIDTRFETGRAYGVVGENGAGKTTLFRCMAGLENYEGRISSDFSILKNHLGFLQTEPFFFSKITGREYLQLLCNARGIAAPDFDRQNIFDLPLNQYAQTYSTGMKKKLALTGVLVQKNDVLILDEPFNGVDIQSNIIISEILEKLKERSKTLIISSHIFSTLAHSCDEIYLLQEGRFTKNVTRDQFSVLEQEMKEASIGKSIERLEL